MATLTIPNLFTAGTSAIASEVNANFTAIKNFIDTNMVQVDGTVKAGPVAVENLGVSNLTYAAVNFLAPTGSIVAFGGAVAPSGYVLCDGTQYPIGAIGSTYYNLYGVLGATYNTGGETVGNFRVPNLKGRFLVGQDAANAYFNLLGETGGSADSVALHAHTADGDLTAASANIQHTHTADGDLQAAYVGNHSHGGATGGAGAHSHDWAVNLYFSTGSTVSTTLMQPGGTVVYQTSGVGDHTHSIGGDGAHVHDVTGSTSGMTANQTHIHDITGSTSQAGVGGGNLPPYIAINYIIKL